MICAIYLLIKYGWMMAKEDVDNAGADQRHYKNDAA
jgi:hypothetical protein